MKQFKEERGKFLARLEIISIDTILNSNGKLTVRTEKSNANPKGIWQFSKAHLDAIARGCGAFTANMLNSAIVYDKLGGSTLNIPLEWVEEGDTIFDKEGNIVINQRTGDTTYSKSHFKSEAVDASVTLTEVSLQYISGITTSADLNELERVRKEMELEAKRLRREKMMRNVAGVTEQQPEDSGSDDDDDELMDIFDSGSDNGDNTAIETPESES
jgi:hypothetical protein